MRIERDQLMLIGTMVAMFGAFIAFGYMPIHGQRKQARGQIEAYRTQLGMDLAGSKELPKLEAEVVALREACSGAQRDVPTQSELASLLRALSSELDRQHATDKEVQTRAVVQGADYNVLPVSLRFSSSFRSVYAFLRQVESMPRLIRIDRMELTNKPDSGGRLNAHIELSTFFTAGEVSGS